MLDVVSLFIVSSVSASSGLFSGTSFFVPSVLLYPYYHVYLFIVISPITYSLAPLSALRLLLVLKLMCVVVVR